jgi:hypothetical protein
MRSVLVYLRVLERLSGQFELPAISGLLPAAVGSL